MSDFIDDTPPEVVKIMGDALVQRGTFTRAQVEALDRGEALPAAEAPAVTTPEGAKAELDRLKRDPEFSRKYIAGDEAAGKRMNELHALAAQGEVIDTAIAPEGAAQPNEYRIPPFEPGATLTPETVQTSELYRTTLAKAGFPAMEGTRLMEEAVRTDQLLRDGSGARLSDDSPQRGAYWQQQRGLLEKVWKGDTQKNIDLAMRLVDEIDPTHDTVFVRLWDSGALLNAWVLKGLYEQASRRARK